MYIYVYISLIAPHLFGTVSLCFGKRRQQLLKHEYIYICICMYICMPIYISGCGHIYIYIYNI